MQSIDGAQVAATNFLDLSLQLCFCRRASAREPVDMARRSWLLLLPQTQTVVGAKPQRQQQPFL